MNCYSVRMLNTVGAEGMRHCCESMRETVHCRLYDLRHGFHRHRCQVPFADERHCVPFRHHLMIVFRMRGYTRTYK